MKCRECKSELNEGAVKCIKCNANQDWRRYLRFSTTVLSLLIALFSVSIVAVPVVVKVLKGEHSNLVINPISAVHRNITQSQALALKGEGIALQYEYASGLFVELVVTNTGEKPGVVSKLEIDGLVYNQNYTETWLTLYLLGASRPGAQVIEPGGTAIVTGFYHEDPRGARKVDWNKSDRLLTIRPTIINSKGETRRIILEQKVKVDWDLPDV